jgi:outer membrane protein assembly factor BamB
LPRLRRTAIGFLFLAIVLAWSGSQPLSDLSIQPESAGPTGQVGGGAGRSGRLTQLDMVGPPDLRVRMWTGLSSGVPVGMAPFAVFGQELGMRVVDLDVDVTVWGRNLPGPVTEPPVVVGDLVIAPLADGPVLGLGLRTGEALWSAPLLAATGPILVGRLAYTSNQEGRVIALDPASGQIQWSTDVGVPVSALASDGRLLFVTGNDGSLRALELDDAAAAWSIDGREGAFVGGAMTDGDLIVTASPHELFVRRAASGELAWSTAVDERLLTSGAVGANQLYVGSEEGSVIAFDRANGDIRWRSELRAGSLAAPPRLFGETLVVMTEQGVMAGFETAACDTACVPAWTIHIPGHPDQRSGIALVGDDIIVQSGGWTLVLAVDLGTET